MDDMDMRHHADAAEFDDAWSAGSWMKEVCWVYDLVVRDLELDCRIGVHGHEKLRSQRVRINIVASVSLPRRPVADDLREVVSYEYLVDGVRRLASGGHVELVETLAIRILDLCFAEPRVTRASVTVEKPEVVPEAAGVGIRIERTREQWS
ncbi:dihydroneopterin aldolase [Arenibaculum pallidiluteum]|uniref:dihydroneopterin aldolase n=1 Tax=Arenibaculum pallidiluteum TaxID=2812559 RepID=UPI001F44EAA8|nr:dihydroneopterin aldolase [Arenibaculum pallidiluteum]